MNRVATALGSAALFVGVVAASWFVPSWIGPRQDYAYDAVAALFSGLAFAALLIALWMQPQELSLQRRELTASREEMARTAKAQEIAAQLAALTVLIEHEREIIT